MLFRRNKSKVETVQQTVQPVQPKRPVLTLGVDEEGKPRGIFEDERVHMAVVGFPGVGKSVSYDCRILVYDSVDHLLHYVPIGTFIHGSLNVPHEECSLKLDGRFLTLAVSQDGQVAWKRVTGVHVHRSPGKLVRIQTRTGCNITVTDDHSLMSVEDGMIKPVRTSLLRPGAPLLKPYKIPPLQWRKHSVGCLELNEDLARLLGYYVSEGSRESRCTFSISSKNPQIIADVLALCEKLSLKGYYSNNRNCVIISFDKQTADEIERLFGSGAENKRIPSVLPSSPDDVVAQFLCGYFSGDGEVGKYGEYVAASTKSAELARGIQLLLSRIGVHSSLRVIRKRATNTLNPVYHKYYGIEMYDVESIGKFAKRVGFIQPSHQKKLESFARKCARKTSNPLHELIADVGPLLKSVRNAVLLNPFQLSRRAGLVENYVWRVEAGLRNVKRDSLWRLVNALKDRVSELRSLKEKIQLLEEISISVRSKLREELSKSGFTYKQLASASGISYASAWRAVNDERDSITILDVARALGLSKVDSKGAMETIIEVKKKLCPDISLNTPVENIKRVKKSWRFSTITKLAKALLNVYQKVDLETAEAGITKLYHLTTTNVWFDPIKHIQSFNSDDQFVYDLSVEDYENFYAEGVFVHNSRFLLSLALQDVRRGRGLLLIDPHGDLVKLFLTHVPRERWNDVIYVDPLTARDYGKVVKINFLECKDPRDRDIVARCFMESLEKIYARFWGPRLDMILMNAIYTLLDSGDTNLSHLYNVIADETFREDRLQRVSDSRVRAFWESEFKKMPKDASGAALTKIYRIVQERIVAPMFECAKSGVDFREAMDKGKIVIVNLSEGAITSDVANFLGSLILSRVYLAGMSREDVPERERKPFYVYVDEAYRFVSDSIRDILQSLRKYRVYMTLASQYLGQYSKEIAESIPHLCDAIITFSTGEETAKQLEEFYRPSLSYRDLMHLPKYTFAASAMIGGRRECQVLRSVDPGLGSNVAEDVIKHSLENSGEKVDLTLYTGTPSVSELPHPTDQERGLRTPLQWIILLKLYGLYEENLGRGMASEGSKPAIAKEDLVEALKEEYGVSEVEVEDALRELSFRGYIGSRSRSYDRLVFPVMVEAPFQSTPMKCSGCGELTYRPFVLHSGSAYCKFCLEEVLHNRTVRVQDIVHPFLEPKQVHPRPYPRKARKEMYYLSTVALRKFFEQVPKGQRGGGVEHTEVVGWFARQLWKDNCFVIIDVGEETPKKTADGKEEYETKRLPDLLVYPTEKSGASFNPRYWDSLHVFAIEVEIDPARHRQRVVNNLLKNRKWGLPVVFATTTGEWVNALLRILHDECNEEVVADCTGFYGGVRDPRKISIILIDPETGTRVPFVSEFAFQEAQPMENQWDEKAKPSLPAVSPETAKKPEGTKLGGIHGATVQVEDWRQLLSMFREPEWHFLVEPVDGVHTLVAEGVFAGKKAKVFLMPYEEHRKELELLGIRPTFKPPEAERPAEAVQTTKAVEEPGEVRGVQETSVISRTAEEVAEPTRQPEGTVAAPQSALEEALEAKEAQPVEKLRRLAGLGYSFRLSERRGKLALIADKWVKEKKKTDTKYVGVWNDELKREAEALGIYVSLKKQKTGRNPGGPPEKEQNPESCRENGSLAPPAQRDTASTQPSM